MTSPNIILMQIVDLKISCVLEQALKKPIATNGTMVHAAKLVVFLGGIGPIRPIIYIYIYIYIYIV